MTVAGLGATLPLMTARTRKTDRMELRLSKPDGERLETLARTLGVSRTVLVRALLRFYDRAIDGFHASDLSG